MGCCDCGAAMAHDSGYHSRYRPGVGGIGRGWDSLTKILVVGLLLLAFLLLVGLI